MNSTNETVGYAVKALVVLFLGLQPTFGAESSVPLELTIQGNGQAEYLAMAHQDALVITVQAMPLAEGDEKYTSHFSLFTFSFSLIQGH